MADFISYLLFYPTKGLDSLTKLKLQIKFESYRQRDCLYTKYR